MIPLLSDSPSAYSKALVSNIVNTIRRGKLTLSINDAFHLCEAGKELNQIEVESTVRKLMMHCLNRELPIVTSLLDFHESMLEDIFQQRFNSTNHYAFIAWLEAERNLSRVAILNNLIG